MISEIIKTVTNEILDEIRNSDVSTIKRDFPNPTAWDINCGWCEDFAERASKLLGDGEVIWLDQIDPDLGWIETDEGPWPVTHAVLRYQDRYYDSQHPNGVKSVYDLDLVKQVSREEFLNKQCEGV